MISLGNKEECTFLLGSLGKFSIVSVWFMWKCIQNQIKSCNLQLLPKEILSDKTFIFHIIEYFLRHKDQKKKYLEKYWKVSF